MNLRPMQANHANASIAVDQRKTLNCSGTWTLSTLNEIIAQIPHIIAKTDKDVMIRGRDITLDSAGAWVLNQLQQQLAEQKKNVTLDGFSDEQMSLLTLIKTESEKISAPKPPPKPPIWLERIGKNVMFRYGLAIEFIAFFGEILV